MPLLCVGCHQLLEQVLSSDFCFSSYLPDRQTGEIGLHLKSASHLTFVDITSN